MTKKSGIKLIVVLFTVSFCFIWTLASGYHRAESASGSQIFTTKADFESAILRTGLDTTSTVDSIKINSYSPATDPPADTRNVAVIINDDAALDADIDFILSAYFANFNYTPGDPTDDVYEWADITVIGDLAGYDIVITWAESTTEAAQVPQDVVEQFADAGGILVQNILEYSYQRQEDVYPADINYTLVYSNLRDMTYDGTYIWTMDDTSPERVVKIDPSDGSTISEYCAPDTTPRGIVYVSGTLYISDSTSDRIYAIAPGSLTPYDAVCAAPAQGTIYNLTDLSPDSTSPWGMAHDGTYFYLVDSTSHYLYQFTISGANLSQNNAWDLDTVGLKPLAASVPRGLAWDGSDLWYADQGTNLIYKLSTVDANAEAALDAYDGWAADSDPTGITFINNHLWVTDDEPGVKKLYDLTSYHLDKDEYEYFNKGNISFETPIDDPKGLVWDGANFWLVEDYTNTLYKLNTDGSLASSCFTPGSRPSGLTHFGGSLYIADWRADMIYIVNPADCSVSSSYASQGPNPKGLAHDGVNLWNTDSDNDLIYKLNPATGALISSFASPGTVPRGLAYDGANLWNADEADDKYYKIDPSTGTAVMNRSVIELSAEGIAFKDGELWSADDVQDRIYNVDSDSLAVGQYDTPAGDPRGFTYDGTNVWICDSGTDNFYRLNAPDFSVLNTYASPDADPMDMAWDGTYLRMTTDANDRVYRIDPSDGSTVDFFTAQANDTSGVAYDGTYIYTADSVTNEIYRLNAATGALLATFDAPGSNAGPLAFDGTSLWHSDNDEKEIYTLELDDDDEGTIKATQEAHTTQIQGIEFISGTLWTDDSYFDMFFNEDTAVTDPTATVAEENDFTAPYEIGDAFYFASRNSSEGYYLQRRLEEVPETASRKNLATSNRGGTVFVEEDRSNDGYLLTMDLSLLGNNYEISRQTVPADTTFLNYLGIETNANGVHDNTRPTFTSLTNNLNDLVTAYPTLFERVSIGTASDGETIYSYRYGRPDKDIIIMLSGTHGNEEHGFVPEVRFMQNLAAAYQADDAVARNLYENYYIIFVPLLNPYGIKNRIRYNQNGVDINRNYDYHWDTYSSPYKGSSVFSEPESQAMRDLITPLTGRIVFINDSHSAMAISPGMTWGDSIGPVPPDIIADIYTIFTTNNEKRWYDERAGVGRWLTYDRYQQQPANLPYFGNWVGSLGLSSSTNEVIGKKDIGTNRYIHTSAWYLSHYDACFKALSYKKGKAVYRINTGSTVSEFSQAVAVDYTANDGSVTVRYGSNDATDLPLTWSDAYTGPDANRYLFVEVTMDVPSYVDSTPVLDDFTVYWNQNITPTPTPTATTTSSATQTASPTEEPTVAPTEAPAQTSTSGYTWSVPLLFGYTSSITPSAGNLPFDQSSHEYQGGLLEKFTLENIKRAVGANAKTIFAIAGAVLAVGFCSILLVNTFVLKKK